MKIRFAVAALATMALASGAQAFTTYTSEAAYVVASGGGLGFESFESAVSLGTSVPFTGGTFSCTGTTYCPGFFGVWSILVTDGRAAVYGATPDSLTFTFSSPITHFGVDTIGFGDVGVSDMMVAWGSNSSTLYSSVSVPGGTVLFAGIIDSAGFTSVTFTGTAPGDGIAFDRLQVKGAVPEPASWALMIAGFGMVGGALRRRAALTA
ncbi:MAG: PEPxxWA-CTERM sorting domain-containing protein [Polymorphobacter sp.]